MGDKVKREQWRKTSNIKDDPLRPDLPIKLGTMAFAGSGRNSRGTQVWIAFDGVHPGLGKQPWETPFAQVVGAESLAAVRAINTEYGDRVDQGLIWSSGYQYLHEKFPRLDYIKYCKVIDAIVTTSAPPSAKPQTPAAASDSDEPAGITDVTETSSAATAATSPAGGEEEVDEDGQLRGKRDDSPDLQNEDGLGTFESGLAMFAAIGLA